MYWHYPHYGNQGGEPSSIIRQQNWKLIHYWEDDHDELYDLAADPSEHVDVAEQHAERVAAMKKELVGYLAEVCARIPARDPRFDPKRAEEMRIHTREKRLPALEKQHARFLDPNFKPNATWWDSKRVDD